MDLSDAMGVKAAAELLQALMALPTKGGNDADAQWCKDLVSFARDALGAEAPAAVAAAAGALFPAREGEEEENEEEEIEEAEVPEEGALVRSRWAGSAARSRCIRCCAACLCAAAASQRGRSAGE